MGLKNECFSNISPSAWLTQVDNNYFHHLTSNAFPLKMFPIRFSCLQLKTGAKHTDNKQTPYQALHFFSSLRNVLRKAPDVGEQHLLNSPRRFSVVFTVQVSKCSRFSYTDAAVERGLRFCILQKTSAQRTLAGTETH